MQSECLRRVYRPWIAEPGAWLQFDWGTRPTVAGRATLLFCAWLEWSRFLVVIPTWDRTLPTVLGCLDTTLRTIVGVATHVLTDNDKTITIERIASVPIRHPAIAAAGRHYGTQIATCVTADPESKGGGDRTRTNSASPAGRPSGLPTRRSRPGTRRPAEQRQGRPPAGSGR